MGNKKKTGKARQDKFYKLAKESGFRARSAFKLLQLNRKFEFLQNSRVIIDLCAAPGGWLQVAAENAPVSSVIIGVDLVPIKPVRNVVTLVDDITTEKCRQDLRREIQTWKADCVLHDGAPNVGKNWLHDAFQQLQLTLHALKLATEFLKKGGWFVTKVFRSKDYYSLLWVLRQLFKNVHATKPQASRNESAEIFVVCQHFLAPDKIDPKFLDPKSVFKDVEDEPKKTLDLIHPEKRKRYREGYPEGDYTLFHTLKVTDLFNSDKHLELLADASEVVFDDKKIKDHPATTNEIKECLKDIKVLGKKEIRMVINWRKKLKKEFADESKPETEEKEGEKEEKSEDELENLEKQVEELKGDQQRELKKKIKKTRKERSKLQRKMDMKMVLPDDNFDLAEDRDMFDLNKIRSKKQLNVVDEGGMIEEEEEEIQDKDDIPNKKKRVSFEKGDREYLDSQFDSKDDEDESELEFNDSDSDMSMEEAEEDDDANPLLVGKPSKKAKMDMWFSKDSFADIENENDEDIEIEKMTEVYKKKGGMIKSKQSNEEEGQKRKSMENDNIEVLPMKSSVDEDDSDSSDSNSESDSDSDSDEDAKAFYQQRANAQKKAKSKDGFEVVTPDMKLGPKGLALGTAIISSRKRKREVIESGYHRYMFNDDNLPDWFVKDEMKHQRVNLPVTKGDIQEYKFKMKAVDANPIKKVAEAKARKKRKQVKKLEKVRKKADAINESVDVSEREKWQQIKQVYKKAGLLAAKKKDVKYVVAKRGLAGKRAVRPHGLQGPYKQVDGRMKKDNKRMKTAAKQKKSGKKRR